ncbi:MAG TPA: hypothetical protein ENJ82_00725 [Bacteroidetes bacterium]|nr:hypothetical protein [Bacteroidota bacterium]
MLLSLTGSAQSVIREKQVPPLVLEEFAYRFQDAEHIVWKQQGEQYYWAEFKQGNVLTQVIYHPNGRWEQTEREISYRQMPDSARAYCRLNYADYQAKMTKKVSTRRYGILYELQIVGNQKVVEMTFDMHGKLLDEQEAEMVVESPSEKGIKGRFNKLMRRKGED